MKQRVVISHGAGPYRNTLKVLKRLELPDLSGKRVLLKPNAGRYVPSGKGITTHPAVVEAAADFFLGLGAGVLLGDSPILGVKPGLRAILLRGLTSTTAASPKSF